MTHAVEARHAGTESGWFTTAVAEELRAHMARKRISGRELARRLHVSAQWISQRTRGAVPLSTDDIERISAVLGITPMQLIGGAAIGPTPPGGAIVTEARTAGYRHRSRPGQSHLALLTGGAGPYRPVSGRYGSSHPGRAYGSCRTASHTSAMVNYAYSA